MYRTEDVKKGSITIQCPTHVTVIIVRGDVLAKKTVRTSRQRSCNQMIGCQQQLVTRQGIYYKCLPHKLLSTILRGINQVYLNFNGFNNITRN